MYTKTVISLAFTLLSTLTSADEHDRLDKPPLVDNLDYLQDGLLQNFPAAGSNYNVWEPGWIPKDCKDLTAEAGFNPADITTYNVNYDDCNTAWVICLHNDGGSSIDDVVNLLGRVPVGARQFVRHLLTLPSDGPHAFNANGNLAMFKIGPNGLTVYLHETGHSLDFQGAYQQGQLSNAQNWIDNYNQDPNVPDPYSQTNQIENVAQNTVLAAYNVQVPDGYGSIEPNAINVFHQYATVQTWQRESGNLLVPGGTCWRRLENSETVEVDNAGKRLRRGVRARAEKPDTSLGEGIQVIERKEFHTGDSCAGHFGAKKVRRGEKPDTSLGEGIEIIEPKKFRTGGYAPGKM
ncbi:MAG: hypothetical protein L6R41_005747 [Letrouitia leprolyta]|nr:MAG: hypothetical protein L6R41_005747 [Letrouitia leprolyta]